MDRAFAMELVKRKEKAMKRQRGKIEGKTYYEVRIPRADGRGWRKTKKFERYSKAIAFMMRAYDPVTKIEPKLFRIESTKTTKRESFIPFASILD